MLVIYNIIRRKTDKGNNRGAGVLFMMAVFSSSFQGDSSVKKQLNDSELSYYFSI